jgi:uncharacterized protein (TIGR02265 family)
VSTQASERRAAIARVGEHCDIEERLTLVPPSARVRGMFFRAIEKVLIDAGKAEPYVRLFPEHFSALGFHPTHEFLPRLAVAGGLLYGPSRVHEGMTEIGKHCADAFTTSALGKLLLRVLAPEPKRLLLQGYAGRRQSTQPVHWEMSFPDDHTAIVDMREEYYYLESYQVGACIGMFEAVGRKVRVDVTLHDAFSGRHVLHW